MRWCFLYVGEGLMRVAIGSVFKRPLCNDLTLSY